MRKALMIALLLCIAGVAADDGFDPIDYPYSDHISKNVFREQMRTRFLAPERWEAKPIVENSGSFIRGKPRNVVVSSVIRPAREPHRRPEYYWGTGNIPNPTQRKTTFGFMDQRQRFFQENEYIKNYQRRVRKEPMFKLRHVEAGESLERLLPQRTTATAAIANS